jgi:hypothetical protein
MFGLGFLFGTYNVVKFLILEGKYKARLVTLFYILAQSTLALRTFQSGMLVNKAFFEKYNVILNDLSMTFFDGCGITFCRMLQNMILDRKRG